MIKIKALTPKQKGQGLVYCLQYKREQTENMMRNFLRINIEEQPNQYYLINGEVTIADDYTKSLKDINKDVFNFLGYGTHIGSETEDGKPDKRLLRFYKENPDKIPDFHKQIFDALTAPKPRSAE